MMIEISEKTYGLISEQHRSHALVQIRDTIYAHLTHLSEIDENIAPQNKINDRLCQLISDAELMKLQEYNEIILYSIIHYNPVIFRNMITAQWITAIIEDEYSEWSEKIESIFLILDDPIKLLFQSSGH